MSNVATLNNNASAPRWSITQAIATKGHRLQRATLRSVSCLTTRVAKGFFHSIRKYMAFCGGLDGNSRPIIPGRTGLPKTNGKMQSLAEFFGLRIAHEFDIRLRTLFLQETIRRGSLMSSLVVSFSHTDRDIDLTVELIGEALWIYRRALDEGGDKYLVGRPVQPVFRKFN